MTGICKFILDYQAAIIAGCLSSPRPESLPYSLCQEFKPSYVIFRITWLLGLSSWLISKPELVFIQNRLGCDRCGPDRVVPVHLFFVVVRVQCVKLIAGKRFKPFDRKDSFVLT